LASRLPNWLIPKAIAQQPYCLKSVHGIRLNIDPATDNGVERSLHEVGTYEEGIVQFMKKHLFPGDVFIDVGANIGWLSCIAAQLVKENGKVLAFEAHPETARLLRENIGLNEFQNVVVFPVALGNTNGEMELFDSPEQNRGGASAVFPSEVIHIVPTQKLDDLLLDNMVPKALKIDVEGFEPEVIEGAMKILRAYRPMLILELTWRTPEHTQRSRTLIRLLTEDLGYRMFRLKGGKERKSKLVPCTPFDSLPNDDNFLFIHR
jgi:FkbM family methyltransferase